MLMSDLIQHRRVRAPQEHGQVFLDPPWSLVGQTLAANRQQLAQADCDFGGRSHAELSRLARHELLTRSVAYTKRYRDVAWPTTPPDAGSAILLAGHQPELFHPGVWFKNFALGALARQHGALAVNLQIDSDKVKSTTIRVPGGSLREPTVESLAFDAPGPAVAYEERAIRDPELFASFGRRVTETIAPLVANPVVQELWPAVLERQQADERLASCLAQSRHQLEGRWGNQTLELPQSEVCQTEAFAWFTAHLLAHLPRFWEIHNAALAEYRMVHRLRNAAQPLPDLAAADDWLEAPLWVWTESDPQRRALYVREHADRVVLTNRAGWETQLTLTADGLADMAVEQLLELGRQGIKLRTRALTTTMFARVLLGDLFLHGIGGAKYDQLTDTLIHRFLGLKAPCYLTVSATMLLQQTTAADVEPDARQIKRRLREFEFHGERFVDPEQLAAANDAQAASLAIERKRHWIATPKTPQNARSRHLEIVAANRTLQQWLATRRAELNAQYEEIGRETRRAKILRARDYAFCLHSLETLPDLILELLAANS